MFSTCAGLCSAPRITLPTTPSITHAIPKSQLKQAFPEAPDLHTHAIGCLGSIVASPDDEIAALAARHGLKAVVASMRVRREAPAPRAWGPSCTGRDTLLF